MTKKDLLNNIKSNYGKLGIDMKAIEKIIKSGENRALHTVKSMPASGLPCIWSMEHKNIFPLLRLRRLWG